MTRIRLMFVAMVVAITTAVLLPSDPLPAQESSKDSQKSDSDKETKEEEQKSEEKKEPEKVKLSGVVETGNMAEVSVRPKSWSSWKVEEAVPHGTRVEKGQLLIRFETEDIDRKIEDSKRSQYAARLALSLAQEELSYAERTFPLDRKSAERAREIAKEDLEYFLDVSLPDLKTSAERSLQSAEYRLEYQQEELDQLEKMYKEDELTEETEEIILKRTRRDVEDAQYFLDRTKTRTEHTLKVDLPRREEQTRLATEKALLDAEKTLATIEIGLSRKQHDLKQQQITFERGEEEIQELMEDRELMTVESPISGIVYYGQQTSGKFTQVATLSKQLRPGGSANANQVLVTVVNPTELFIRVTIAEKDLQHLKVGTEGSVVPTAFPDTEITAELAEISLVPTTPGQFEGIVKMSGDDIPDRFLPGMGCEFVVTLPEQDDSKE